MSLAQPSSSPRRGEGRLISPGSIPGLHHVTAITADPQANVDFYAGVLGLRFVKRTVNFDDPGSYHLYFGDELGRPGGIMTFFGWPGASRGRRGAGQLTETAFSVPPESLDFWTAHLRAHGVEAELSLRFGDEVLSFADPDGLALELIASPGDDRAPWDGGPVPPEHGIRGFRAITVTVASADATAGLLTGPMGFETVASRGSRSRFVSAHGARGGIIDVLEAPRESGGIVSAGTVHHVAWRTPGDEEQLVWRAALIAAGRDVTHVYDRRYFHSIYFREPGGVLFEIATDPPGFTLDEPAAELGARLALPPWLEESRPAIEAHLPPITMPVARTTRG